MRRMNAQAFWILCGTLMTAFAPTDGHTRTYDPAAMCDSAAVQVADETDVPLDVLRAITRTETGRASKGDMRPWPWTVNMEGQGVWFDNEAQAQGFVFRHFRSGARSFDIGCFQINYKWHGHEFANIEAMFDPVQNTRYAARFLQELYGEHGDWTKAVGAYHSRTQKYAARYLKKYERVRAAMPSQDKKPIRKSNSFPLLTGEAGDARAGSLVPQNRGQASSLFAPRQGG